MLPSSQLILDSLGNPEELEVLYDKDPPAFRSALDEVMETAPDDMVLRTWKARLEYSDSGTDVWSGRRLW